jgi:ribosomal protein S14
MARRVWTLGLGQRMADRCDVSGLEHGYLKTMYISEDGDWQSRVMQSKQRRFMRRTRQCDARGQSKATHSYAQLMS